ncbi:MAG: helix-turn-helix transcriptional regulator [Microbacterium sp.]
MDAPRPPIPIRPVPGPELLTRREHEVLALMAQGQSNHGISVTLHVSERTVESHITHIMDKLGVTASPSEHRRVLTVLRALKATA